MIALPSDVARAQPQVQTAYQHLLEAMTGLYERSLPRTRDDRRATALALAALSVGGMVLARTIPDATLGAEVREAAFKKALEILATAPTTNRRKVPQAATLGPKQNPARSRHSPQQKL
jgi:hypothetical protein